MVEIIDTYPMGRNAFLMQQTCKLSSECRFPTAGHSVDADDKDGPISPPLDYLSYKIAVDVDGAQNNFPRIIVAAGRRTRVTASAMLYSALRNKIHSNKCLPRGRLSSSEFGTGKLRASFGEFLSLASQTRGFDSVNYQGNKTDLVRRVTMVAQQRTVYRACGPVPLIVVEPPSLITKF